MMVASFTIASSSAPEAAPASASAHPSTEWGPALILLAVVLALSAVMGFVGWKKRDQ